VLAPAPLLHVPSTLLPFLLGCASSIHGNVVKSETTFLPSCAWSGIAGTDTFVRFLRLFFIAGYFLLPLKCRPVQCEGVPLALSVPALLALHHPWNLSPLLCCSVCAAIPSEPAPHGTAIQEAAFCGSLSVNRLYGRNRCGRRTSVCLCGAAFPGAMELSDGDVCPVSNSLSPLRRRGTNNAALVTRLRRRGVLHARRDTPLPRNLPPRGISRIVTAGNHRDYAQHPCDHRCSSYAV